MNKENTQPCCEKCATPNELVKFCLTKSCTCHIDKANTLNIPMVHSPQYREESWETEFRNKFVDTEHSSWRYPTDLEEVYSFLRSTVAEAEKQAVEEFISTLPLNITLKDGVRCINLQKLVKQLSSLVKDGKESKNK